MNPVNINEEKKLKEKDNFKVIVGKYKGITDRVDFILNGGVVGRYSERTYAFWQIQKLEPKPTVPGS